MSSDLPTPLRDNPRQDVGRDWDEKRIIGERTGRSWIKFTGAVDSKHRITIIEADLCDPMEWR